MTVGSAKETTTDCRYKFVQRIHRGRDSQIDFALRTNIFYFVKFTFIAKQKDAD